MGAMGEMGAMGAAGGAATVVTVLKYILITLGGGLALGLVGGLVYAGLRYPNPNKKQMFTTVQKIIVMVIALVGVALIVFAFVKKPKPDGDMMVSSDMSMVAGVDGGSPVDADGNMIVDDETSGGENDGEDSAADGEDGAVDSDESSEESSSESGSEVSAAEPTPAPPMINGGNVIIGGGNAIMRPM